LIKRNITSCLSEKNYYSAFLKMLKSYLKLMKICERNGTNLL